MDDVIPSGIWCWLNHINKLPDIRKALPEGIVYLTFDFDANPFGHRFIRIDAAGQNARVSVKAVPDRPTRLLCEVPHSTDLKVHVYQTSGQPLNVRYTAIQASSHPPEREDYDCHLSMAD